MGVIPKYSHNDEPIENTRPRAFEGNATVLHDGDAYRSNNAYCKSLRPGILLGPSPSGDDLEGLHLGLGVRFKPVDQEEAYE